jgi:hypothetical protein
MKKKLMLIGQEFDCEKRIKDVLNLVDTENCTAWIDVRYQALVQPWMILWWDIITNQKIVKDRCLKTTKKTVEGEEVEIITNTAEFISFFAGLHSELKKVFTDKVFEFSVNRDHQFPPFIERLDFKKKFSKVYDWVDSWEKCFSKSLLLAAEFNGFGDPNGKLNPWSYNMWPSSFESGSLVPFGCTKVTTVSGRSVWQCPIRYLLNHYYICHFNQPKKMFMGRLVEQIYDYHFEGKGELWMKTFNQTQQYFLGVKPSSYRFEASRWATNPTITPLDYVEQGRSFQAKELLIEENCPKEGEKISVFKGFIKVLSSFHFRVTESCDDFFMFFDPECEIRLLDELYKLMSFYTKGLGKDVDQQLATHNILTQLLEVDSLYWAQRKFKLDVSDDRLILLNNIGVNHVTD